MKRRVPVLATLVVAAAIAAMVALGFWQLQRRAWKEDLIARYTAAMASGERVAWPRDPALYEAAWFHRSGFACADVLDVSALAGRNRDGQTGWAHTARCQLAAGGEGTVALGWSRDPAPFAWAGGPIDGVVQPAGSDGVRLVAAAAPPGLEALALPDPTGLPNNHLAYAVQWFLFAVTALVIYVLALRRRSARDGLPDS